MQWLAERSSVCVAFGEQPTLSDFRDANDLQRLTHSSRLLRDHGAMQHGQRAALPTYKCIGQLLDELVGGREQRPLHSEADEAGADRIGN